MATVTVSPKFQVVIPLEVRRSLGLRPGDKIEIMRIGDCIEFVPVKTPRELRGKYKGMNTNVERDEEDRI
jgi:AbrB family looped-hinge helix DNA binding protein